MSSDIHSHARLHSDPARRDSESPLEWIDRQCPDVAHRLRLLLRDPKLPRGVLTQLTLLRDIDEHLVSEGLVELASRGGREADLAWQTVFPGTAPPWRRRVLAADEASPGSAIVFAILWPPAAKPGTEWWLPIRRLTDVLGALLIAVAETTGRPIEVRTGPRRSAGEVAIALEIIDYGRLLKTTVTGRSTVDGPRMPLAYGFDPDPTEARRMLQDLAGLAFRAADE